MKRLLSLILGSSLFLASCSITSSEPTHNQFQITLTDVFKHQHTSSVYQFELITKELSNVKDKERLAYLSGMIDSYLISNPLFLPSIIFNNGETKQIIADEQLQSEIVTLYQNKKEYLKKIQSLINENNLLEIQGKQDELKKLSELMGKINDDRLFSNDKPKLDSLKKDLENVIKEFSN
ncbi:hypothetical protein ABER61_27925 [Brevibacillus formosus]|uniref:Lipoprotein n=1 Tax=Brevibacillus formosus TaxID=54913 RepID=A0A837KEJ2_9BACL|nr:hypothetical protein [Brevibacillus formosus]KLH95864.1 hypothetical protein AA984_28540 [Brevibacillus formosus]MED1955132.1 hypothetical protein [Brevibacillus formosus]PSJ94997.1 hypothetical protein C7R91_16525 [Brevibacillus formosus]GED61422.1 hypothetical protein BFO01nite_55540 [Brevibacillus formosus]